MDQKSFEFIYSESGAERLDRFLAGCFADEDTELSRSRIQALIKDGMVSIDGTPVTKVGTHLEQGQQVVLILPPPAPTHLVPEDIQLDILFENDDVVIVNKPAGMVVHPSAGHSSGTLVHAVLAHSPEMEGVGGVHRPGVVHRLDKDTSGIILLAKNDRAHQFLQAQFKDRKVVKIYDVLVDGRPPTAKGRVEAPIGRDAAHRQKMAVVSALKGRDAVSEYFTEKQYLKHTLLKVHILTGRTHQIRLHMLFLGCPVVGDTTYGHRNPSVPIPRQFLHAGHLEVCLPGEDTPRVFDAPLPADLQQVLDRLL